MLLVETATARPGSGSTSESPFSSLKVVTVMKISRLNAMSAIEQSGMSGATRFRLRRFIKAMVSCSPRVAGAASAGPAAHRIKSRSGTWRPT
jgi:hypothetical protein